MNRIENFESEERQSLLTAYALEELEPHERAQVEGWLAGSPQARERLSEIRHLNAALLAAREGVPLSPPSACLRLDVLGRLAELQSEPASEPVALLPMTSTASGLLRWATLATALLLTAGLVWTLASGGRIDPARERLTQQLARYDALMQEGRYEEAMVVAQAVDRQVAESHLEFDTLIELITSTVSPQTSDLLIVEQGSDTGSLAEVAPGQAKPVRGLQEGVLIAAYSDGGYSGELVEELWAAEGYSANNEQLFSFYLGGAQDQQLARVRQRGFVDNLYNADTSAVPFPEEPPIVYPEATWWFEMSKKTAPGQVFPVTDLVIPGRPLLGGQPDLLFATQGTSSQALRTTALDPLDSRQNFPPEIPVVGDFAALPEGYTVEQYDDRLENVWLSPLGAPLSTFSVDVDTASYANVRRFLSANELPPTAAVRVEEFVNYFHYDYAPPSDDAPAPPADEQAEAGAPVGPVPFAVHLEVAECPWNAQHQLVRIGLRGRDVPTDDRPESNLVFLLDVSGSMESADRLPLVKEAMLLLVDELNENDLVTIVTFSGAARLCLEPTAGNEKVTIRQAIENLHAGGSTYGKAGIEMAYDMAVENFIPGGTNRVLWATDGDLNVGPTDDEALIELVSQRAEDGVFLAVLGVGRGNLQDAKLEGIADNGNGHYAYLDSLYEAQKVLVHDLSGTLITIAQDVKLQVEFNPEQVAAYRLIGYENRLLEVEEFDDDTKDAGEIGAGHTITALYELIPPAALEDAQSAPADDSQGAAELPTLRYQVPSAPAELTPAAASDELLVLALRYKEPTGTISRRLEYTLAGSDTPFAQASEDFRFAAAAASFAMLLRRSEYAGSATFASVEEYAAGTLGEDTARGEFIDLVRQAGVLSFEGLDAAPAPPAE